MVPFLLPEVTSSSSTQPMIPMITVKKTIAAFLRGTFTVIFKGYSEEKKLLAPMMTMRRVSTSRSMTSMMNDLY